MRDDDRNRPQVIGRRRFDLLVLDEACQTTEPGCWAPLLRCDRVVLAGDHCQLPPTVVSKEAARHGFGVSLLERLVGLYGDRATRRLDVQYRMHEAIMAFSSAEFYDDALRADVRASRRIGLRPGRRERTEALTERRYNSSTRPAPARMRKRNQTARAD